MSYTCITKANKGCKAAAQSPAGVVWRGFNKGHAKACVDKCHDHLDPGRALRHRHWSIYY